MMEDNLVDFYSRIGELATKFAILEYQTGELLSVLINKEEYLLTSYLIQDMNFFRKIETAKELADFRINNLSYREKVLKITSALSGIRKKRNLFIHGLWSTPEKGNTGYSISVREHKIKKTKSKAHEPETITWIHKPSEQLTKNSLEQLVTEVNLLTKSIDDLIPELAGYIH